MMPALVLVGIPGPRWLPPVPLPLFLLWPLVPLTLGLARLTTRDHPRESATMRAVAQAFCELRGLAIDVETRDHEPVRIWFV